jgi:hypothetical protein
MLSALLRRCRRIRIRNRCKFNDTMKILSTKNHDASETPIANSKSIDVCLRDTRRINDNTSSTFKRLFSRLTMYIRVICLMLIGDNTAALLDKSHQQ